MARPPPPTNPYGKAAQNYSARSAVEESSRATEARVLLKAAKKLQDLQSGWDSVPQKKIEETLKFNRQIWALFYDNALSDESGKRPQALSSNVISLASFIFKRSVEILAAPEPGKLNILININREIASGLMTAPAAKAENI